MTPATPKYTRAAYPIGFNPNIEPSGLAGHPRTVFFLTADAFGVLPPIARLTPEQAKYHFLSGYTAKLAGTEKGLGNEPQTTFSSCFGAPFLPLHPRVYADLLGEKLREHKAQVWLVNTGWTGGPYGVGHRIDLPYTRALVHDALRGELDNCPMRKDPYLRLRCAGGVLRRAHAHHRPAPDLGRSGSLRPPGSGAGGKSSRITSPSLRAWSRPK